MMQLLRKAATSVLLIAVVALGARLAFAWNQIHEIPVELQGTLPFQTETGHIACSLATGKGYSSPFQRDTGPTAWLTPVYPLLVAGIFKLFGVYSRASFLAAILLNVLFSSVACVPIFFAGKRVAGLGTASAASWLWALFINAIMIPFEWIWDTSLAALLAAILLWATLKLPESKRLRDWCGYGFLWGVALMTNPALAGVFPFLLAWLIFRARRERLKSTGPAMAAALALLCCVPWTVRNFVAFHRLIPLRSNLSFELYIGNNENYDERHRGLPPVITQDREILRYLRMGEMAFMDEERRKALQFIVSHPRVELWLFANRIVDFWMGTAAPVKMFVASNSLLIRAILLGNLLSTTGGFLGVAVLFWRREAYAIPLAAFPVVFPILYYVTHTSLRYRHPIDPVVLLLTAIAAAQLGRRLLQGGLVVKAKRADRPGR